MSELKPCPFCGESDAHIVTRPDEEYSPNWVTACGICFAIGPLEAAEAEAKASWNMRPLEGISEGQRGELYGTWKAAKELIAEDEPVSPMEVAMEVFLKAFGWDTEFHSRLEKESK